jgi:DNA-binding LytR/AlgR family response regulator
VAAVWLLFSVVIALPMCVLVPTVSHLMFGWQFGGGWQTIALLVFYVWVISAAMAAIGTWLGIKERNEADAAARLARLEAVARLQASGGEPARALRERLPMRLRRATIHALQAEDHYVRVHTAAGSELLLMRLADAIREAEGLSGLQTHRSWWVAEAGVAGVERDGERVVIRLHGGAVAPVSRSWQKAVREAGWR